MTKTPETIILDLETGTYEHGPDNTLLEGEIEYIRHDPRVLREAGYVPVDRAVSVKPLFWNWIGSYHAYYGGGEIILTKFRAPERRKMWRVHLKGQAGFQWFDEDQRTHVISMLEADYDQRSLSALTMQPASDVRNAALEEAADVDMIEQAISDTIEDGG